MHRKIIESIIAGMAIAAITASAKAIIDVQILKSEDRSQRFLLLDVRQDVKSIKQYLLENKE